MNKLLIAHIDRAYTSCCRIFWRAFDQFRPACGEWLARVTCKLRRKPYRPRLTPRWQQLELPLSHTPVQRWNR
ncbi:hypothetical protein HW115_05720 [Verrucomicrobiaceae bacterium N1E253]|uniref:Uncharacterized protein n=1 Tax=Oceaniferula marina TaxID=2748318 RepID=A0A851GBH5_9BACT|nr:hypothetical protein [Oceaniferula marina]NWK55098.1 hypothetical protein [Oceaniferula marina]